MLAGVVLLCAAAAQMPRIGDINFYGLHEVTAAGILETLHIAPGDALPPSKGDTEERTEQIPGVASARIQVVCCQANRIALFIGIQERGQPGIAFHLQPVGEAELPQALMTEFGEFQGAVLRGGPPVKSTEDRLSAFAADQTELLRSVLRTSWDAEQRQAAATIIGYAPHKKAVLDDLLFALQDPDPDVRSHAAQSLSAIAVLARKSPELGIRVPATWFVELLDSVELSDRLESTKALLILTEGRDAATQALIRRRAMPALVEMANWKTLSYARPPFLLLGRVAGLPDAQVRQSWEKGDRDAVIQRALKPPALRPPPKKRRK
jgi:hypothetical protein